jgi:hypothetical protein
MPKWNLFEDCGISSSIFPPVSIEPSEVKIDCKCTELGDQIKMEMLAVFSSRNIVFPHFIPKWR